MNRRGRMLLLVVALAGVAAGCASSGEPDDYDETVAENFATSCEDANSDLPDSESQESPSGFCGCVYDFFVANVEYDTFKDLNDDLEEGVNDDRYNDAGDLDGVLVTLSDGISVDDRTTVSFGALIDGCLAGDAPAVVDTNELSDSSDSSDEGSDESSDAVTDEATDASDEATTTTTEA